MDERMDSLEPWASAWQSSMLEAQNTDHSPATTAINTIKYKIPYWAAAAAQAKRYV